MIFLLPLMMTMTELSIALVVLSKHGIDFLALTFHQCDRSQNICSIGFNNESVLRAMNNGQR